MIDMHNLLFRQALLVCNRTYGNLFDRTRAGTPIGTITNKYDLLFSFISLSHRDIYPTMSMTPSQVPIEIRVKEKFWKSVEKTDYCWNWTGPLDKSGLPVVRVASREGSGLKEFSSRRLSLEYQNLPIAKRVQPLICKNKLCVNPDHLVTGDAARFWAKVIVTTPQECWNFYAGHDKNMYGKYTIRVNGIRKHLRAHVYSFFLRFGFFPKKACVCHTCDHPWCVNPNHLFLGSNNDNTQDKVKKGRQARGETSGTSKLTEIQVKEIRELYPGMTVTQLSKLYGMSSSGIASIVKRKTWRHI